MTWLDQALGWFSPELGYRRASFRAAMNAARQYEGASIGRGAANWKASSTSANSEISGSLGRLINRSRQMVRDNPYAKAAIERMAVKAIGTGIVMNPPKSVKKAFNAWSRECDFDGHFDLHGLQLLAAQTEGESGACIIRRHWSRADTIPLRLQVLEPDYIDTLKFGPMRDGFAINGIQVDRFGRKVGYWLYDSHPGEQSYIPRSLESRFIPASEIIYLYRKRRPGQLHGVPALASSLMRIRSHDEWQEARRVKKKIESCLVGFIPGGDTPAPIGQITTGEDGRKTETMSPGMIYRLRPGESAPTFTNPSTAGGDGEYSKEELHAIAVGTGVSYELMTGEGSGLSFSNLRGLEQNFRDLIDCYRWIDYIPIFLEGIVAWWLEAAFLAGAIRSTNQEFSYIPPRWPYVQPHQDIKAVKDEILGGLTSLPAEIRKRGEDPDEVLKESADYKRKLANAGLKVDTDPETAAAKSSPAAPADSVEGGVETAPDDEKNAEK